MAETTYPVTIVLRADGKGLTGTLKLTAREARQLDRALNKMGKTTAETGREAKTAGEQVEQTGRRMNSAGKQAEKFGARAQASRFRVAKLGKTVANVGDRLRSFGRVLSITVTATLLAASGAAVKFASDFEDSFADVRKTVNATESQFEQMAGEFRQMAKEVPTAVEELNRLGGVAGQLGVQRENIVEFTRTIAMLGDTTDIAGEQAALSISRFMNVMGTAQTDIDRVGSTIVGLGNNFAAMESEIVDTATSLASFGSQMGLRESEVLAFATAIAASGGQTEAASTAFQKTAATMQRAVLETNEDLALFARTAGVSAEQFAQSFRDNASGALVQFLSGLQRVSDQGQSTAAVLEELGLADQRLQREFGKVIGNLDQLEAALGVASDEWQRNTALTEEAQKRYGTFASETRVLWNTVKDLGITIGNDLIPSIRAGTDVLTGFLEGVQSLDPETRMMVITAGALVAAAGPVAIALGGILHVLTGSAGLIKTIGLLTRSFQKSTAVSAAFKAGLGGAVAVLGTLAFSIGAVIGYELQDTFHEWADGAKGLKTQLQELTPEMDRFTGAVARQREEDLMARLDQEQQKLARMEATMNDSGLNSRLGDTMINRHIEEQTALVAELSRELEINRDRWDEHNRRVIEADNGIGDWGSAMQSAIEMARNAQGEMKNLSDETDNATSSFAEFEEWLDDVTTGIEEGRARAGNYAAAMVGMAEALFAASTGMRSFNTESQRSGDGIFPDFGMIDRAIDGIKEIREEVEKAASIEWSFQNLIDSFHPLSQAMRQLGDDIELVNARIESGQLSQMEGMFLKSGMAANAAFGAMMDGVDRTSQEYKQLEVAQQAVNVALGIAAIMQQGMGDPYTAIPRMVAMAAMVAQLVDGIGGLSGGSAGSAEQRQETQGTGTVLGDPGAKSESIANATEITADATSELVGINRAQLRALERLQDGIEGAAGLVARGAGNIDLSGIDVGMSGLESAFKNFDPLGYAIDSFVGGLFGFGKTKIKDQGIALMGGLISDMTEGAVAQAFGDLKRKSLFGSKSKTVFEDLDDEFNTQLNLIFDSMIDTVSAAGEALGIPLDQIQARIDQFEVEAQEISLKDLSAEEAQAELEAVFSAIFDDLANSVIPFLGQFQKVGEGMGEAMVRVATSVQVTEEAVRRLGLSIGELEPERMAQVSVGLVEAAGGIDSFITQMESFVDKFAPAGHQFEIAQSDITRALDQMNMALPESREGFWNLLQSIDATTAAGQRHIATLLSLGDAADAYYNELEAIQQEREGLEQRLLQLQGDTAALRAIELESLDESNRALQERIWGLEDEQALQQAMGQVMSDLRGMEWSPLRQELYRINQATLEATAAVRARGGAEEDYALIQRRHTLQIQALAGTLRASLADMRDQLFGGGDDIGSSMQSTASTISGAMGDIQRSMIDAIQGVRDWLDSSLLDNNSPLLPQEQLDAAGSQFWDAISAAQGGDADAASQLPQLADQFLGQASSFWGTSTAEYQGIWEMVRDAMQGIADMDVAAENRPPTYGQQQAVVSATQGTELSALEQARLAGRMVDELGVLSRISGDSPADIARELGIPIGDLMEAVTGDMPTKTGEALRAEFNDFIEDADAQLSTLGRIEGVLTDIRTELQGVDWEAVTKFPRQYIEPPPEEEPPKKASGGWSTGIVQTGELGPELILPHDVSTFFQRNGVPVNSGGSDPQTRALLSKIEQRLAKLEALAEGGHQLTAEQIRAIREGDGLTGQQLDELLQIERKRQRQRQPVREVRP